MKRVLKEGKIVLKIDVLDDLWHLYNVLLPGDTVIARTVRRVRIGDEESRKQESVRKPMVLTILVEDISFHAFSNRVRVLGKIVEGPRDLVSIGSHHTINVEVGSTITIIKDHWPRYLLKRLEEAEKTSGNPVCLIVTIEDGSAVLFLAADYGLKEVVRVRTSISRKRGDQKSYDKSMREFFSEVAMVIRSQLEQNEVALVVIAGPGFVKDHFREYLSTVGIKGLPPVIVESTNSTGVPGAKELLFRGVIGAAIRGLKLETETKLIDELITHIAKDDGLATYGDAEVERAVEYGAVEHLLITDKKLREGNDEQRRRIDKMIRMAEQNRSNLHIVSTEHPAGDQLQNIGGIAAILRFKMAD